MITVPVTETSQVAESRRRAVAIAQSGGFNETAAGRVAIVVTELATNLIKHAAGGEIVVGLYDDDTGAGIEILSLDRGAGIADLDAALQDGYSSAGTPGRGLGAIVRQSQVFDIVSWPGNGTVILARLEGLPQRGVQTPARRPRWGAICLPIAGEEVSGDAWSVASDRASTSLIVADGLGHGPEAATASTAAIRLFHKHAGQPIATVLACIHDGLRATRGAAVSIARFEGGTVSFCGVGNVTGKVVDGAGRERNMVSLPGTAGHNARKFQVFDYPMDGARVVLHSDGLASRWSLDKYPGLFRHHPTLMAAVLYRDFARQRDDVTVLVVME
jgi:anti-sigma regulatory factor (Ser/Thr protein kinase)